MNKYILHGGYTKVDNELNKQFFKELTDDLVENSRVLIICFARNKGEDLEIFERDKNNILKNSGSKSLKISMASYDNFINELKVSDAIFLCGGDAEKLLAELKKYPEFSEVIKNKTTAGSSAGAYALSKYYYSQDKEKVFEGLGILPIKIICHYDGSQKPVEEINRYSFDMVVLKDYEYKIIER